MAVDFIIESIQIRRDSEANWGAENPVLLLGEPGYEVNTGRLKVGDGVNLWSALPYIGDEVVANLASLSDVSTATPTNKNILVANGTDWSARALTLADISNYSGTQLQSDLDIQTGHTRWRAIEVPAGGATGQVLKKVTGNNYDVGWANDNIISDAASVTVVDAGAYYASNNVESILQEIGSDLEPVLTNITVTQAVNLDTMESDIATNNAKVSNATHTGDVTGSTVLSLDPTAITGKTTVTAVAGDFVVISDTSDLGNLKKVDVNDFLSGGGTVGISGTPVNNQLAIWTDGTTIEGDAELTYDGNTLALSRLSSTQFDKALNLFSTNMADAGTAQWYQVTVGQGATTDNSAELSYVQSAYNVTGRRMFSLGLYNNQYLEMHSNGTTADDHIALNQRTLSVAKNPSNQFNDLLIAKKSVGTTGTDVLRLLVEVGDTTLNNPTIIGANNYNATGKGLRFEFGDEATCIQSSWGESMVWQSFHTSVFRGSIGAVSAVDFNNAIYQTNTAEAYRFLVNHDDAFVIKQDDATARTQDWLSVQTSAGTKLLQMDSAGDLTVTGDINAANVGIGTNTLSFSGGHTVTFTSQAATNVTLPTSGILATTNTSQTLTNKTLTTPTFTAGTTVTNIPFFFPIAMSNEVSGLTTGTKYTMEFPIAAVIEEVFAYVTTAPTGSGITIDIEDDGVSIFSTALTIDATENSSETAATAAVISGGSIAANSILDFDVDVVGSTTPGAGLKLWVKGYWTL